MKTHICSLIVMILVSSACDNRIPVSPDPGPTLYTISGTVTEMTPSGPAPLEGALVDIGLGSVAQTMTDAHGLYTLSGLGWAKHSVTISKDGYAAIRRDVDLSVVARLDLQLSRTYTLSGVVFEVTPSGRLPVEEVGLYCDVCGLPLGDAFALTNANGEYRFERTANGATPLWFAKGGYALAGNQPVGSTSDSIVATVEGDTRFDIELVRR